MSEMSLHARMVAYLESEPVPKRAEPWSNPAKYAGVTFRSQLEAGWAITLDSFGIAWEYEPELAELSDGRRYLPDFRLPGIKTVIEAKGPHMQRMDKARDYACEHLDVITLIGYPPHRRSLTPTHWESFMQWGDALGGATLFTRCAECRSWQWFRVRYSPACRNCGRRLDGNFATCGELHFTDWTDQPFEPLLPVKGGNA